MSELAVSNQAVGDAPPDFELVVTHRAGGTTVLELAGELDLYHAPDIEGALAEAAASEARSRRVVIDLRAVTFLDSGTLGLLLAANGRQQARGGELLILVGPHTPRRPFEVTGFDRLLTIKHVRPRRAA